MRLADQLFRQWVVGDRPSPEQPETWRGHHKIEVFPTFAMQISYLVAKQNPLIATVGHIFGCVSGVQLGFRYIHVSQFGDKAAVSAIFASRVRSRQNTRWYHCLFKAATAKTRGIIGDLSGNIERNRFSENILPKARTWLPKTCHRGRKWKGSQIYFDFKKLHATLPMRQKVSSWIWNQSGFNKRLF